MRNVLRSIGANVFLAAVLALALSGCSTGPSDSIQTSSLAPRETPRYTEAPRRYVDPGHPTPREFAAASDQYGLEGDRRIQTASIAEPRRTPYYGPDPRWRQPAAAAPITTGSTGYGAQRPYVVEVREGDTLYSLSRRYNVPMRDLAIANRLPSERIVVGQHLVIPTQYR